MKKISFSEAADIFEGAEHLETIQSPRRVITFGTDTEGCEFVLISDAELTNGDHYFGHIR